MKNLIRYHETLKVWQSSVDGGKTWDALRATDVASAKLEAGKTYGKDIKWDQAPSHKD